MVHCGRLLQGDRVMGALSPSFVMVFIFTKYPVCSLEKDGMGAGWVQGCQWERGSRARISRSILASLKRLFKKGLTSE